MAMAADIATDIAKEIGTSVLAGVIQQVKNVVELEGKLNLLNTDFGNLAYNFSALSDRKVAGLHCGDN